ncbi:sarcosine oxidase, alpha subunit family, heterotetrameric form [Rubellimicrobium thermophilum DSM 16684]|uniref:Sarcosine oxidase, alpha subunit family, heterotetrameric form n=1 Tax=Rubellimicrobium thermophilum DSM 16684 TaxID=1123069 RepID=S9R3E8_9RHOB|nr:sarcosine oxidase subunit alpha family protein [Rubellimicrobium thermophilum]EPX86508.1 sarcosine oxidase, alpha subunit family, heterotetrameric form [Rubellimicrobium thermophilum DSM 16684]
MRVAGKGLYQGAPPVSFRFDGVAWHGVEGDTLASALLGEGVRLMGRSFKYHRPRGVLSAGSEEPNALVCVDGVPNTRATMQEIWEGMEATSQNARPSLRFDVLAVNDWLAPFIGAGFYYKTFMWPRSFWERVYEPLIRRAAGLGRLDPSAGPLLCEKAWAFCDVLVIGAGPAGLSAALAAGRAGARVILADEGARMGGRLLAETDPLDGQPPHLWVERVLAELVQMPNVRLMPRTTVTGVHDGGTFAALERVSLHRAPRADLPRECFWRIVARRAVLCAGAIERPLPFPDNDRPGVMLAGAVRAYLNHWGVAAGRRVVVFGNNDDAHRTARDCHAAGLTVAALVDSRPEAAMPGAPFPVLPGARIAGTRGRLGLSRVTVEGPQGRQEIEADVLAVSGGWSPSVHLACHLGARPVWDDRLQAFLPPPGGVPWMTVAGAAAGEFTTAGCLRDGWRAASAALADLGLRAPDPDLPEAEGQAPAQGPFIVVEGRRQFVDFQNDVTVKDIRLAVQEGFCSVEHMKRYTTLGMATDQGKTGNVPAIAILSEALGSPVAATGTTTFRPPYTPVSIGAMGAGGQGMGFAPRRLTTSHAACLDRGAPMIEAGLWYRPGYFPRPGETTWRQSCDREVTMVRQAVGVADVSTLGKIDIQGPDAAALLDFVYCNTFSTLPVGRVRYGLMLREDGHVMDDGTTARLGGNRYIMTTTTAAAGQVMRHLDFVTQVLRPDLDVHCVSVTEQWAQFSVAGPRSRDLVQAVVDADLSDAAFPYMACAEAPVMGVPGRVFRISFSGERAYELAVPARYGASLYRLLVAYAESLGGGPYGMEALNVLRIEKGYITHAEIHGRTTAFDIGMERMVSKTKDCIGWAASRRPGLLEADREQLVGLRPVAQDGVITAGAHLYRREDPATRLNGQGYVTSACWSPTLGRALGLGFLRRGRERHGEVVRLVDAMRGVETLCEVTDPVFLDPKGERLRG